MAALTEAKQMKSGAFTFLRNAGALAEAETGLTTKSQLETE